MARYVFEQDEVRAHPLHGDLIVLDTERTDHDRTLVMTTNERRGTESWYAVQLARFPVVEAAPV